MVRPTDAQVESREDLLRRVPSLDRVSFSASELQIERRPERNACETTIVTDRLSVYTIPLTPMDQNCRILRCEKTGESAIIDPGSSAERLRNALDTLDPDVKALILTHAHPDHCGGLKAMKDRTGADVYSHPHWMEQIMLMGVEPFKWLYKFKDPDMTGAPLPDKPVRHGDSIQVGELRLQAMHTPGHSPGHLAYYLPDDGILFSGDLLFREYQPALGRNQFLPAITDIPGGNKARYAKTIQAFLTLPEDTLVLSGHLDDYTMAQMQQSTILDDIERGLSS